jgi:hypothetical protein
MTSDQLMPLNVALTRSAASLGGRSRGRGKSIVKWDPIQAPIGSSPGCAVLPLGVIMLTAIVKTKLPILLGGALGPLPLRDLAHTGFVR